MAEYELLIRGGRVLDPQSGLDERLDLAVSDGKIAAIGHLDGAAADREILAEGCLVTPGLIDMHAHIAPLCRIGAPADLVCLPSGVTTVADAGSAGFQNYHLMRPGLMGMHTSYKIFLHVSSVGLAAFGATQENIAPAALDRQGIRRIIRDFPDEIVGLKIRMGKETAGDMGLEPLRAALDIAHGLGLPLMVHCTNPPVPMAQLTACLEKGDILTHPYHGKGFTILDEGGMEALQAARQRGVYLDVGDARGHTSFQVMRKAMGLGLTPDSISTDMTWHSMYNTQGAFSLLTCINKWLNLGMEISQAIACVTINPAREMGVEDQFGVLAIGRRADIAVLREENTAITYTDGVGEMLTGNHGLRAMMTVKDGRILYRDLAI